jgi:hypothetical protein
MYLRLEGLVENRDLSTFNLEFIFKRHNLHRPFEKWKNDHRAVL